MKKAAVAALAAVLVWTGSHGLAVAQPQQGAQTTSPEAGPYPDNYETLVRDYYARALVDPDSVQYRRITEPAVIDWGRRRHPNYAYLVCVTYNARNRMGGYAGYTTSAFIIKDGAIIDYREGSPSGVERITGAVICPPG
jgi:hypothetical protein